MAGQQKSVSGNTKTLFFIFFFSNLLTSYCVFSADDSHSGIWNGSTVTAGLGSVGGYLEPLHGIHLKNPGF